jgi:hypothetical protein
MVRVVASAGSWISPEHVRPWRSRARMRHTLLGERTQWMQRTPRSDMAHTIAASSRRYRGSHPKQAAAHQR